VIEHERDWHACLLGQCDEHGAERSRVAALDPRRIDSQRRRGTNVLQGSHGPLRGEHLGSEEQGHRVAARTGVLQHRDNRYEWHPADSIQARAMPRSARKCSVSP